MNTSMIGATTPAFGSDIVARMGGSALGAAVAVGSSGTGVRVGSVATSI
jgi:hypothetical protein